MKRSFVTAGGKSTLASSEVELVIPKWGMWRSDFWKLVSHAEKFVYLGEVTFTWGRSSCRTFDNVYSLGSKSLFRWKIALFLFASLWEAMLSQLAERRRCSQQFRTVYEPNWMNWAVHTWTAASDTKPIDQAKRIYSTPPRCLSIEERSRRSL